MSANWDYPQLFYSFLDDKERDFFYLSQSYLHFYKVISFYFLIYFLTNLLLAVKGFVQRQELACVPTDILGGYQVMTILLIPLSFILFCFNFKDYLAEFETIFYPVGHLNHFSQKYHKKSGAIALSIWGLVLDKEDNPVTDATIKLGNNGTSLSTNTDNEGYFQFLDKYADYKNTKCSLVVKSGIQGRKSKFYLIGNEFPYLKIKCFPSNAIFIGAKCPLGSIFHKDVIILTDKDVVIRSQSFFGTETSTTYPYHLLKEVILSNSFWGYKMVIKYPVNSLEKDSTTFYFNQEKTFNNLYNQLRTKSHNRCKISERF
ncbi:MAG: carboxypeptidase-like regulatory domain-containing protein [Desulfobaccales bacterium]